MTDNKITVYVGDVTEYLSQQARLHDETAKLVTRDNFQDLVPGTYYTSIGDLDGLDQFAKVLRQAHKIVYVDPGSWSDARQGRSQMKIWTEDYLTVFACDNEKIVQGLEKKQQEFVGAWDLVDHRRGDYPQIWIAGCSISHGVEVKDHERYGHLLSEKLGMPASFLTRSGSSILWAADQILRSDLRCDDVIFWGLTGTARLSYWNDIERKVSFCTNYANHKHFLEKLIKKEFLVSDHLIYQAINSIYQVVNVCDKLGVKLILSSLLLGTEAFLKDLPNFILMAGINGRDLDNMFFDIGSDGIHPGPKSHQYYADRMLERYHKLYNGEAT